MAEQADLRKFEQRQEQKANLYTPRGGPSTFRSGGSDGYNVESFSYPDDLFSAKGTYGGNYVVFYINVGTDSKLAKSLPENEFVNDLTPRDRGDLIAQNLSKDRLVAAQGTVNTITGIVGGSIAFGNVAGALKGTAIANIPTVGLAVTATLAPDATRSQKRLKTAIAMHVPNQLQIRYGMQWSEEDTTSLSIAAEGIDEVMKALDSKGKDSDVKGVGAAIIANLTLGKTPGASAALGLAANPKKEQVFKGVDFRTFQFDYQFFPRSSQEAKNVLNIIQQFKYHMHPELFAAYPELANANLLANPYLEGRGQWNRANPSAGVDTPYMQINQTLNPGLEKDWLSRMTTPTDPDYWKNQARYAIKEGFSPRDAIKDMRKEISQTQQKIKDMESGVLPGGPSVALHELQHGVQSIEGFAPGGNPSTVMTKLQQSNPDEYMRLISSSQNLGDIYDNAYRRIAGEVEARAVQKRINMSPEQRRQVFPLESYDRPVESLLFP